MQHQELRKIIRELIDELEETSVTGAIYGGAGPPKTPMAFSGGRKKDKKKKKKNATNSNRYTIVDPDELNEDTLAKLTDKDLKKLSDIIRMELSFIFYDLFRKKHTWV